MNPWSRRATLALMMLVPLQSFGLDYPSVPGEIVVRLQDSSHQKTVARSEVFAGVTADLVRSLHLKNTLASRSFQTDDRFAVLTVPSNETQKAIQKLTQDSRVAYAEPNYLFHIIEANQESARSNESLPNDELFGKLWGLKNTGQADATGQVGKAGSDIHVAPVWSEGVTGSRNVKVAVIDTGVDYQHPDLKDNIWTNPLDQSHGWNFVKKTNDPMDDHYHGTHCAGTIGGLGNNSIGVTGVNWKVTIVPVKFLDSQGSGTLEAAAQAIQFATKTGVNIMSNSWGGGPFTQTLYDAIKDAGDHGILFVAAAGNDANDNDTTPTYPASYKLDNILVVAATDNQDKIASFSNYGQGSVHVAAPGVQILSTAPASQGSYKVLSGTSMATPHVAGMAALLLSANPSATFSSIKTALIQSSDPTRALASKSVSGGRVNLYNAIHGIVPPAVFRPDESAWKDFDFTVESPHPYVENQTYQYSFSVPHAKFVRVIFESIDTEANFDWITVRDATGEAMESISGLKTHYVSDFISGDHGSVVLKTDAEVNKMGFKVSKLQAVY